MSDIRQQLLQASLTLCHMGSAFDAIIDRFLLASAEFGQRLKAVRPEQWGWPTPCSEWDIRKLVNHMTRGNLSYVSLLHGGTSAEFLLLRDADALGADPAGSYIQSVQECAEAFAQPGALEQVLDYPLGHVVGRQALAVRTTDTAIHTWDLARAVGLDENLNASLVTWIDDHIYEIYAGLAETPIAAETTHRFFAVPECEVSPGASRQDRLLNRMGRKTTVTIARPCRDRRDDVTEDTVEPGGDVRVGLGGQPQVVAVAGGRGMPHVGLQDRR